MTGYNLETGITTLIEAEVVQEGSLVLSARLFGEIVRKLPDDVVSVSTDGNNVSIVCGPTSFDIVAAILENFQNCLRLTKETPFLSLRKS